jgi:hypothetical protein
MSISLFVVFCGLALAPFAADAQPVSRAIDRALHYTVTLEDGAIYVAWASTAAMRTNQKAKSISRGRWLRYGGLGEAAMRSPVRAGT